MRRSLQSTLFALAWAVALSLGAAEDTPVVNQEKGKLLWEEQCVRCHGENGEGVDEEYDEPLYGSWSLEKLTRIIHKTMPEDDPDQCLDADAEAVAQYIYDTFYSLEARARNQEVRVELAHLTNRQYLNSVADLIAHFTGGVEAPGKHRGLEGDYYTSRRFRGEDRAFERTDYQVHFDFGEGSPDAERFQDEEFSIQWRGSVIADETGDYEFIVKSQNGVRLWVNDRDTALIDGWVTTGKLEERRAKVKLIGGRAYPIRLDFFKFKEANASISLEWVPPHQTQEIIPARNLTPDWIQETLVITTPFPPDDSSVGYERGVAVSKAWDNATTHAAIEAANHVVKHLDRLTGSDENDADRGEKVREFCHELVETAFRRPLSEEQKTYFVDAHLDSAEKLEDGVKRVVLLALKSPRFLYIGLEDRAGDPFTAAEKLSFGLWDSIPDKTLFLAAERGRLENRSDILNQAERMIDDPRAKSKMQYFLHHWLQLHHVEDLVKDDTLYPDFSAEIIADLRTSLNLFLEDAVWGEESDYRELLTADYVYVNDRLARFYGIGENLGNEFVKVKIDQGKRFGVITHPYLLSAFSYNKSTSPIHRGVFLTRNIVGRALKPPPMAIEFKDSEFDPSMTMREKVAELTRPDACQTCHSVINPLGFSLENFDAVGRYRTTDNNQPVDTVSDYLTHDGEKIKLTGAGDLARYAASSPRAHIGFIEQLFHQVAKQPMLAYGSDVPDYLNDAFAASDYNVRRLLVEIATLSAWPQNRKLASN